MKKNQIKNFTREQMIDLLIKDKIWDWIFARNDDELIHMLEFGFGGYSNFTDKELKEKIEYVDVEEIIMMTKRGLFEPKDTIPF